MLTLQYRQSRVQPVPARVVGIQTSEEQRFCYRRALQCGGRHAAVPVDGRPGLRRRSCLHNWSRSAVEIRRKAGR